MASFPLKTHFSYPHHSTSNLKKFPLHCTPKILYVNSLNTGLIIRVKSFPTNNTYPLAQYIHYRRQTDVHTTTRTIDASSYASCSASTKSKWTFHELCPIIQSNSSVLADKQTVE